MKYLVLGAGLMGQAVAYDLAQNEETEEIRLADIDLRRSQEIANWINKDSVKPMQLDVNELKQVHKAMEGINTAIGCISYNYNYNLSIAALESKTNFVDLGGNNTIVNKQFTLNEKAKEAGITIVPDCGLAPGVVSILVADGIQQLDSVEKAHIRVGGLPQKPKPPLDYMIVFSVKGLINEYKEKAEVIRDGKIISVDSLSELEELTFPEPFGTLEAFQTSGGTSTLPKTLLGKINELDYKTIRYKGHCEKIQLLFDLGLASEEELTIKGKKVSPREILETVLTKNLSFQDKDVVLLRVQVVGTKDSTNKKLEYELIDYYDEKNNITAMMRNTAYPASIIAQMLASNSIKKKGVIVQEFNIPSDKMIEQLKARGIDIKITKS